MRQFSSTGFIVLVMVAYSILATIYFVQHYCWENIFAITIALPTLFATTLTAMRRRHGGWFIPLALGFSTLGDYAGAMDNFFAQVAFFAVAHIFFIADFLPQHRFTKNRIAGVVALVALASLFIVYLMPSIEPAAYKYAIVAYALIIATMASSAIIQDRQYRGWYILAAVLFVMSDSAIAYRIATGYDATFFIMPTYYTAQAIFTVLYMLRKRV